MYSTKSHSAPEARTSDPDIITGSQLSIEMSLSARALAHLRRRRVIPYFKISYRCIRYSRKAVMSALQRFEVKEIGSIGG